MRGSYKPFDRKSYEENDARARAAVVQYLRGGEFDIVVIPNEDLYGPDLVASTNRGTEWYVECEIKYNWKSTQEKFPFSTVQLPERKQKFLNLGIPVEFWILREDCGMAVVIPDTAIDLKFLREVPNSRIASGELFYQIPLDLCNVVDLRSEHESV